MLSEFIAGEVTLLVQRGKDFEVGDFRQYLKKYYLPVYLEVMTNDLDEDAAIDALINALSKKHGGDGRHNETV